MPTLSCSATTDMDVKTKIDEPAPVCVCARGCWGILPSEITMTPLPQRVQFCCMKRKPRAQTLHTNAEPLGLANDVKAAQRTTIAAH